MAIMDKLLVFGEDFSVATAADTILFTNQIDLGAANVDIGNGQPMYLHLVVTGGDDGIITAGSAGTIQFRLVSDDSATIHDTTCSVHLTSKAYVTDDATPNELHKGDHIVMALPAYDSAEPFERYLGVQVIVGVTEVTEGTVTAWLSPFPNPGWRAYADANN